MTKFKQAKVIYDNDIDFDDAKKILIEQKTDEGEPIDDITDEQVYEYINDLDNMNYNDEYLNLNKHLDGRIICLANVGTWQGRRYGYKVLGNNLNNVLQTFCNGDYLKVEYDGDDVVSEECHHDGTNRYTFRELREEKDYYHFFDLLLNGEVSQSTINRYTKSLKPYVKDIYGW